MKALLKNQPDEISNIIYSYLSRDEYIKTHKPPIDLYLCNYQKYKNAATNEVGFFNKKLNILVYKPSNLFNKEIKAFQTQNIYSCMEGNNGIFEADPKLYTIYTNIYDICLICGIEKNRNICFCEDCSSSSSLYKNIYNNYYKHCM